MRLFLILSLIIIILILGLTYYSDKINTPPKPGTLSYYRDKIEKKELLTENDSEEIKKIFDKIDADFPKDFAPKKSLKEQIKDAQKLRFYFLVIFSAVFFLTQYLVWDYIRNHLLLWLVIGVLFTVSGVIPCLLSEQNLMDVLLLKDSNKYFDSPLGSYAAKPFAIIIWGYILTFNNIVCLVIDRVLAAKEIRLMFNSKE
jgi:hypothetical protein